MIGGAWVRSPRIWIGGVALTDLIARAPEDVVAPVVSLLGGYFGGSTVAFITSWLLVAVVFYHFAPLVYSLSDTLPRKKSGFRTIFAASGVALGVLISSFVLADSGGVIQEIDYVLFGTDDPNLLLFGAYYFLCIAFVCCVFLWYLSRCQGWELFQQGRGTEIVEVFTDNSASELEAYLKATGVSGIFGRMIYLVLLALILGVPVVLTGLFALFLILAYPITDLLLLGWVLGASVSKRVQLGPNKSQVLNYKLDLERYVLDALENTTRGLQGVLLSMYILFGMLISGIFIAGVVAAIPLWAVVLHEGVILIRQGEVVSGLFPIWNVSGAFFLLVFAGGFALWGWIREWRRLPHFLDYWEGRDLSTQQNPVSRVPGLMLLPTTALCLLWLVYRAVVTSPTQAITTSQYVLAILWPVVVGFGLRVGIQTYQQTSQSITGDRSADLRYEHYWITSGVILLLLPFTLFFGDIMYFFIISSIVAYFTGLLVPIRYEKESKINTNIEIAYLQIGGGVFLFVAVSGIIQISQIVGLFGVTCVVWGVVQAIVNLLNTDRIS